VRTEDPFSERVAPANIPNAAQTLLARLNFLISTLKTGSRDPAELISAYSG
jgi:hypothetical protein